MYLWCILEIWSLVRKENIVVVSESRGSSVVLPVTNWCIVTQLTITTTKNLQSLEQHIITQYRVPGICLLIFLFPKRTDSQCKFSNDRAHLYQWIHSQVWKTKCHFSLCRVNYDVPVNDGHMVRVQYCSSNRKVK